MRVRGARIGWVVTGIAVLLVVVWVLRPRAIPVESAVASIGSLEGTIDEDGLTEVVGHVEIAAPVSGRLTESPLRVGDPVSPGTIVGVLRPAPLDPRTRSEGQAALASARSLQHASHAQAEQARVARDQSRRDRERAARLANSGTLARRELEAALALESIRERELEAARARESAAAQDERRARSALVESDADDPGRETAVTLRSPIAGRVLRMFEEHDRVVPAGTPLVEIGDPGRLRIVTDVLSRDAVAIVPGMTMIVRTPGRQPVRTQVDRVEPSAFTKVSPLGVEEQRVNVIGTVLPESLGLGDRFEVDVSIVLWSASSVLKVPSTALVPVDSTWAVYVVADGRARLRRIEVARQGTREVQVGAGLADGERVIVHPDERVKDGIRVRPAGSGGLRLR